MNLNKYFKISEIENDFTITHNINDEIFGKVYIHQKNNSDGIIMSKHLICDNKNKLEYYLTDIINKKQLNHPNLLNLVDYSLKELEENKYEIKGFYIFPSKNLYHIINEKAELKLYWDIDMVKKIFSDILEGLIFLENNNLIHGDLRPEYIAFSDLNNNFIISDRLNCKIKPELKQYFYIKKEFNLYTSPIIFKGILNKERKIYHSPFKSQIFSFGMILWELLLLKNIQDIYDTTSKSINEDLLNSYINEISDYYDNSQLFINLLKNMLKIDENERLSLKELKSLFELENSNIKFYDNDNFNEDNEMELKLKQHKIIYKTLDGNIYSEEEYYKLKKLNNENSLTERTKLKKSTYKDINLENYEKTEVNVIKEGKKYIEILYKINN